MAFHCREELIEAPSLPAPEVVKVRIVLIHGASGRCEQVTEETDYAPLLINPAFRNRLLSDLGRKVAFKMTASPDMLPKQDV